MKTIKHIKPLARAALVSTVLSLAAAASHATTFTIGTPLAGPGAQPLDLATLTVTQSGDDLIFSLDAAGLDLLGPNAFLGAIAVNGLQTGSITEVSGDAPVAISPGGGPGGSFDFRIDLTGPKQARLTDGETVSWTWADAGQDLNTLQFAAHVQGGSPGGSSWFAVTAVPEPESYALLGAGLGVMGVSLARRRRRD